MTPTPRTRRAALVGAVCTLVASGLGLTGCSEDPNEGTNGVGKLTPEKIQTRTKAAATAADTVRLSGSVVSNGKTYKLDVRLKEGGGTGSVTSGDTTFRLLKVGEHLFLKADAEFWDHEDGGGKNDDDSDEAAADKLDGMYVKVPTGDPAYQRFSGFTDKDVLLNSLLTLHGTLSTDGHHEQSGTRTIRITGDKGAGGTLDVSLEGTPYPLRLVRAGDAGTILLTDWGKNFSLEEPDKKSVVDYGKQLPTS
ncbi:hypothetical protein CTU88_23010 [Streptomyces sp. JV178]|uniref:hypothetical protein n=1 Tax=unclassified Streptomyces TaxID=2593676 RepID=UPI000C1B4F56|nr:hypothetical protein [Streptomyces sp. JV178]PIM70113.1 hypothetical protein CTU88_23010 [Streptomyces sp. JV178]